LPGSLQICLPSHPLHCCPAFRFFLLLSPFAQGLLHSDRFSMSSVLFCLLSQFLQPLCQDSIPFGFLARGTLLDNAVQVFHFAGISPIFNLKCLFSSCKLSFFLRHGNLVRLQTPLLHVFLDLSFLSFSIPSEDLLLRALRFSENWGQNVKRPTILPCLFGCLRSGKILKNLDFILEALVHP
jgi:hypothetical protein